MSLTPEQILAAALELEPIAIYVGFSGGRDSICCTHWMMSNIPGCRVFHCNTGIGIERSRVFVRETCARYGWPLDEIRAKEDCGQDYDAICLMHGFPGPAGHQMMFARLKERAIRVLVKRAKVGHGRRSKVLLATGVRYDESLRRMRYATREVNNVGSQMWVNPIYWWSKPQRDAYIAEHRLPVNPISEKLGMSGECLCGAFAHPGELATVRQVCPETGARIDALQERVAAAGFTWGWEGHPPSGGFNRAQGKLFMPLCVGCEKSAVVQAELEPGI